MTLTEKDKLDKQTIVFKVVHVLKDSVEADIQDIKYDCDEHGRNEVVTIYYWHKDPDRINVNFNSCGAIIDEIMRQIYGEGAHGLIKKKSTPKGADQNI